MRRNNIDKARELVENGLNLDKTHPLLNMIASQVYEKLNDENASINYCKNAFELNAKLKSNSKSSNVLDIIIDNNKLLLEGVLLVY